MMATQNNANQNSNASPSTNILPTQQGNSNNTKNNISQSELVSLKDNTIIISKGYQFPDSKIYIIHKTQTFNRTVE